MYFKTHKAKNKIEDQLWHSITIGKTKIKAFIEEGKSFTQKPTPNKTWMSEQVDWWAVFWPTWIWNLDEEACVCQAL